MARELRALLHLNGEGGPRELGKAPALLLPIYFDRSDDRLLRIATERLED